MVHCYNVCLCLECNTYFYHEKNPTLCKSRKISEGSMFFKWPSHMQTPMKRIKNMAHFLYFVLTDKENFFKLGSMILGRHNFNWLLIYLKMRRMRKFTTLTYVCTLRKRLILIGIMHSRVLSNIWNTKNLVQILYFSFFRWALRYTHQLLG